MSVEQPSAGSNGHSPTRAGVIGVGHMGRHHARIYSELADVTFVGVHDTAGDRASTVASEYGGTAMDRESLLEAVDVVSVAVPTEYHYETVRTCLEAGVHVLVEKPFVDDLDRGSALLEQATEAGLVLQVGHIERFNPATQVLLDVVADLDVVAVDIRRLGPPVNRHGSDNVIKDLMVHDVDILLALLDGEPDSLAATAWDERHATAQFQFDNGTVGSLTASRLTQQKIRELAVTARSCRVTVDFISQTVEIHRQSLPEYVEADGDIRYRHESVVEHPTVENGEPLRAEIEAFIQAVRTDSEPPVTGDDALDVMRVINRIESLAFEPTLEVESS